jgi:hypothetical protein
MTDTDMLYMASLEKRNEELEAKVAELEGKHWNECGQIAHFDDELRKAKRLLRLAVDDFDILGEVKFSPKPGAHPKRREYIRILDLLDHRWRYTDEALKLIGDENDAE